MKVTKVSMKNLKKGEKPFDNVVWKDATAKDRAEVYSVISNFTETRVHV